MSLGLPRASSFILYSVPLFFLPLEPPDLESQIWSCASLIFDLNRDRREFSSSSTAWVKMSRPMSRGFMVGPSIHRFRGEIWCRVDP